MTKVPLREEQIQASIIQGLSAMGYVVLQTSHRRKMTSCPRCGSEFRPRGGYGASKGVPDLIVTHKTWPPYVSMMLEVKGPKTEVSAEQMELQRHGRVYICRSWEQALAAVQGVDQALRGLA